MTFARHPKDIARLTLPTLALCLLTGLAMHFAEAASQRAAGFVGSQSCTACHAEATQAWKDSHHAWAWRTPTQDSVLGDFENTSFLHDGVETRFSKRDGRFLVETEGPSGKTEQFEVHSTVGVTPLQQYLIETAPGQLQSFDVVWDSEKRQWYHLYPDQKLPAKDGFHWTGPYKNWNARCADCHATGYEKNYDPRSKSYQSHQSEIAVTCEACHGPAEAHVAWAKDPESFQDTDWQGVDNQGLTFNFQPEDAQAEIELCAACHARRSQLTDSSPLAGTPFDDSYRLALLREGLYFADGQIQDEVYVTGSFLQSKMYARGVRCTNCHEPHSGQLRAQGDAICTQCHNPLGNTDFPTLPKAQYDSSEHHFHDVNSEAARCTSCHMPERLYMVVDGRRDHSFRVPRPDLSDELGTPNACTSCHQDKSNDWAAREIKSRYPKGRMGTAHYGEDLAAARSGDAFASLKLLRLALDRDQPAIVRATALNLMRTTDRLDAGASNADAVTDLLADPSPLVRASAAQLQESALPAHRAERLVPLLEDSRRAVRIAAAQALIDVNGQLLPQNKRPALRSALAEYRAALLATTDFPETQMNLARLASRTGNQPAAVAALQNALELDPQHLEAWRSLGSLQHAMGQSSQAEATFHLALAELPDAGDLHRLLGLLYAERGDYARAAASLQRAVALLPNDARLLYNLSLSLQRGGRQVEAEAVMKSALTLAPDDADILYALAVSLANSDQPHDARSTLRRLLEFYPDHRQARQLWEQLGGRQP